MPAVACVTIGEVAAQMVYSLVRRYMTQIAHVGGDDRETQKRRSNGAGGTVWDCHEYVPRVSK